MDDLLGVVLFFSAPALLLGVLLGSAIGVTLQLHVTRESMAAAGVAEWRLDSQTGDKRFVYVKGPNND